MRSSVTALFLMIAITLLPTRPAESSEAAAGVMGGMIGLMVGSALQADRCHQVRCSQDRHHLQQRLMREVLRNYDPAYHSLFEEYVLIDLEGWLTTRQQEQLLQIIASRRTETHCIR